ncbi:MAG: hypothetical protein QHH75_07960 [Bacillota bacterium]|jgi:hypothetical protein|nr:hypothetical protein [Bacillota bacterium]
MDVLQVLKGNLSSGVGNLKQAVDLSIELRALGKETEKRVNEEWQQAVAEFIRHVQSKSQETGRDLFAEVAFPQIE